MALVIPTRTDLAVYRAKVDLGGVTYTLDFQYNSREGAWYFDLLDAEGDAIRTGIKVVTGFPLLRLISDARAPDGELVAVDSSGGDAEAGLEDLGNGVQLVFADAEEVDEAEAEAS